jgi:IclR helix-turn-helix domain
MGFWDKSRQIFNCLCANATQSVRRIAQQTGLSKSRAHRLTQAMERRNNYPESWLWETADGRQWLMRLVVATLYTFGFKRGVGLDTMSEFFARVHLETQLGCSPSALCGVRQALEAALLETAATWEQDGQVCGEVREIMGPWMKHFWNACSWASWTLPPAISCWERSQMIAPMPRGRRWWKSDSRASALGCCRGSVTERKP